MPKILVAEDEADIAMGLRDNLEFEGYEVIVATDGEAALEAASEQSPDLALLDIMMPKMDGLEVCRRIRQAGFMIPILMLTARSQEIDIIRGLEVGADDYITKPFSVREVLARIKAALRRTGAAKGLSPHPPHRGNRGRPDQGQRGTRGRAVRSWPLRAGDPQDAGRER